MSYPKLAGNSARVWCARAGEGERQILGIAGFSARNRLAVACRNLRKLGENSVEICCPLPRLAPRGTAPSARFVLAERGSVMPPRQPPSAVPEGKVHGTPGFASALRLGPPHSSRCVTALRFLAPPQVAPCARNSTRENGVLVPTSAFFARPKQCNPGFFKTPGEEMGHANFHERVCSLLAGGEAQGGLEMLDREIGCPLHDLSQPLYCPTASGARIEVQARSTKAMATSSSSEIAKRVNRLTE